MRIVQRVTAFFLAAVLMTSPFTAMAATSTKISGVSLRIASDIEVGSRGADVSVSTISSKYYVEEVEIKNEPSDEWEDGDKPKIKVTLEAADDYYFASGFSKGDVNLTGNDGTVTSVSRTSSTLVVSITLEALEGESEYDLDVDGLDWDAEDGTAYWNENEEAKKYEIRLYRGSTAVTSVITTTRTSYHFGSYITKGGYYTFQVRGVYNSSNKGSWKESESWYVTSAEAAEISSNSSSDDNSDGSSSGSSSGSSGPGATAGSGAWLKDDIGWWYCNADRSYTVSNWQYIDNVWYYFNETGYMVTGWVQWNAKWYYCSDSGAMLANTTTPDGYYVGSDGAWIS